MFGCEIILFKESKILILLRFLLLEFFFGNLVFDHFRSYNGALFDKRSMGISPTFLLLNFKVRLFVFVVLIFFAF